MLCPHHKLVFPLLLRLPPLPPSWAMGLSPPPAGRDGLCPRVHVGAARASALAMLTRISSRHSVDAVRSLHHPPFSPSLPCSALRCLLPRYTFPFPSFLSLFPDCFFFLFHWFFFLIDLFLFCSCRRQ